MSVRVCALLFLVACAYAYIDLQDYDDDNDDYCDGLTVLTIYLNSENSTDYVARIRSIMTFDLMTIQDGQITMSCNGCPNATDLGSELALIANQSTYLQTVRELVGDGPLELEYTFRLRPNNMSDYYIGLWSDTCRLYYNSIKNRTITYGEPKPNNCSLNDTLWDADNARRLREFLEHADGVRERWNATCLWNVRSAKFSRLEIDFWYEVEDGRNLTKCGVKSEGRRRMHVAITDECGNIGYAGGRLNYTGGGFYLEAVTESAPGLVCTVRTTWLGSVRNATSGRVRRKSVQGYPRCPLNRRVRSEPSSVKVTSPLKNHTKVVPYLNDAELIINVTYTLLVVLCVLLVVMCWMLRRNIRSCFAASCEGEKKSVPPVYK
ncbi:m155 protein [Murid betaherpesvirus 1]|uniref:M155 protein n=1 Tax=Murid herpesvirus 1 TaxID=10366 RepID=H2A2I2_MUHV1|nr:m155 protein [Murid betaherpesvirus 1]